MKLHHTIVGAPIAADPTPNATAPVKKRIFRTPAKNAQALGGAFSLFAIVKDGTSATFVAWVFSEALGRWSAVNAAVVCAADAMVLVTATLPPETDVFVQATAAVGAPTTAGFLLV